GFQPVEADRTGLCIAVRHLDFQALGGTWDRLIESIRRGSPRFAALLAGSRPALPRPLAVAGVPYGFLHRPDAHQAGAHSPGADRLFRLGDQAAVIPSLTGHGLAIALHSGRAAAEAWLAGRDARTFHAALRQALARQMRLSGALHAAFLSPSLQPWVLRAARLPGLVRHTARLTRIHAG
ncbi:MAG TPA: hypothetical protein VHB27_03255, partial [Rhodopila sp.]|uniref:hypothetical protein n=1 Tax=Rhodopila sp. TaxID=2480087 RepID=UPI002C3B2158